MPQQVPRLVVLMSIAVVALVGARQLLIPDTFGDLGHYRAAAIDVVRAHPIKYAGRQACYDCHTEEAEARLAGNHRGVSCETCHGPSAAHVDSALDVKPTIPDTRKSCVRCHAYNASRPTGFPQIEPDRHNYPKPCKECHNPHAPVPPTTPGDCAACHNQIAQQKTRSPHAELACSECHTTPQPHLLTPRSARPTKPRTREECGRCHASGVTDGPPQVDLLLHGAPYACWDCHYPHYPEAPTR